MKSLKLAVLAISLIGIFGVGNVMAADLDVTANVTEACAVVDSGLLEFGLLDSLNPVAINNKAATTNPTIRCTNGTNYEVTDDSASKPLNDGGTSNISYTLSYTGTGLVADGNAKALPITGSIVTGEILGKSAGTYTAGVTLTITIL